MIKSWFYKTYNALMYFYSMYIKEDNESCFLGDKRIAKLFYK